MLTSILNPAHNSKTTPGIMLVTLLAALVNGLLAGGNVDRAVVARPAWSRLGLAAWADYTRQADLGNGQIFYPAMAFAGTLLCITAAVLLLRAGGMRWLAAGPVLLAAALMVVCLPISFVAAPFILSLRHVNNQDLAALAGSFNGSDFWGRFQMALHVLAFLANLWAVAALGRSNGAAAVANL